MKTVSAEAMKVCRVCKIEQPISRYYKDKTTIGGLRHNCKACHVEQTKRRSIEKTEDVRAWRRANADHLRQGGAKWREKNREYRRQLDAESYARTREKRIADAKEYAGRNPEKSAAHKAVTNAISRGDLVRGPCEVCGSSRTDAHHDDYRLPLSVRWLCRLHHKAHHAAAKLAGTDAAFT